MRFQLLYMVVIYDLYEGPKPNGCIGDGLCIERIIGRNCHPPITKPGTNEESINDCRAPMRTFSNTFEPRQVSRLPVTDILIDHLWKRDVALITLLFRDILGPINSQVSGGRSVLRGAPQHQLLHGPRMILE
jgi:hypothetical protein